MTILRIDTSSDASGKIRLFLGKDSPRSLAYNAHPKRNCRGRAHRLARISLGSARNNRYRDTRQEEAMNNPMGIRYLGPVGVRLAIGLAVLAAAWTIQSAEARAVAIDRSRRFTPESRWGLACRRDLCLAPQSASLGGAWLPLNRPPGAPAVVDAPAAPEAATDRHGFHEADVAAIRLRPSQSCWPAGASDAPDRRPTEDSDAPATPVRPKPDKNAAASASTARETGDRGWDDAAPQPAK